MILDWEPHRKVDLAELDWIDSKLSDRRSYLVGDRFSRVDVTVASLLSRPCERGTSGRWHIHCAIELPSHFDAIALESLSRARKEPRHRVSGLAARRKDKNRRPRSVALQFAS
jgi:glutathione S-transferase